MLPVNGWMILLWITSVIVAGIVGFLFGRDSGETRTYQNLRETNERLMRSLHEQRVEHIRLQRAMDFYDADLLRSIYRDVSDGKMKGQGSYPDPE